jgi:hypothetical protein
MQTCETCGRPQLIVKVVGEGFATMDTGRIPRDVLAREIVRDILR